MDGHVKSGSVMRRVRQTARAAARALPLALILVPALLTTSCGDDGGSSGGAASPSPVDAVKTLEAAAAKMSTAGLTAHIAFGSQLVIDGPNATNTVTATGSGDLEMPTTIRYVVDVTTDDGGGALEVVTLDGLTYYTRDANDPQMPWSVSDSPLSVPFDLGKEIDRYLAMSTQAEVVKSHEEDGQRMHVVRVTLDPLAYASGRAELDMEAVFAQTFGLSQQESEKALAKGRAFVEFTVGEDDGYVHGLTERWLVRLSGGKGFLQEVVLAFSRFGKPIEPPIEEPET